MRMLRFSRTCLFACSLLAALPGIALCLPITPLAPANAPAPVPGAVPFPAARYTDADSAAIAVHPRPGNKAAFRRTIDRRLQANPRDVLALTHRAHFHYLGGHPKEGQRDYERALSLTTPGSEAHRHVLWSWGWSLYDSGDAAQALEKWQTNVALANGHPYWVPYTFALAAWKLDRRADAIAWFEAAVRSNPQWGTAQGRAERTAQWRDEETAVLAEVVAAWEAATKATP
jgi:tetratricopeptide (TPR) repeat protein